jgi:hypothetical protein
MSQKILFTEAETAVLRALGDVHRAEQAAQKHRLVMETSAKDVGELMSALLRSRYRETVLRIRLAHNCPEDQFTMHGSESGYWFEPEPATVPDSSLQFTRNNASLS